MADVTYTELNIGQIRPTPKGTWSATQAYNYLDIVKDTTASYIAVFLTGVPAGISTTNTTYWQPLAADGKDANEFTFATETDYQNKDTTKPINSGLMNPKLTTIDTLITTLSNAITAIEGNFTPEGQVNDSANLGGKAPNHYDCGGGCSWTCMAGCMGGCDTSCTGNCHVSCTGACSSCTGTCTGGCSSCKGSCSSCTGSCEGRCTSCTGSCSSSCTARD